MAAPLLNNNVTVLSKVEATYGTDPTPVVATDAVLTSVPSVIPDGEQLERNLVSATLSPEPMIIGRKLQNASFQMELKSELALVDGATLPESDPTLQCLGLVSAFTAESGGGVGDGYITYTPTSTGHISSTYYFYYQDVLYKVTGAFGDATFTLEAGMFPTIDVNLTGLYNVPTDSTPGSPTVVEDKSVQVESIALTINAVANLVCRSVSFSLGNNIVERRDVNSAEGLKGLRISSRVPTATVVIEEELMATFNPYTLWDGNTTFAMSFIQGSATGTLIAGTFGAAQIVGITPGEDAGIKTLELQMRLNKVLDAGDDELSLKFY